MAIQVFCERFDDSMVPILVLDESLIPKTFGHMYYTLFWLLRARGWQGPTCRLLMRFEMNPLELTNVVSGMARIDRRHRPSLVHCMARSSPTTTFCQFLVGSVPLDWECYQRSAFV
eukprot:2482749-Amphidinium_carterae.3